MSEDIPLEEHHVSEFNKFYQNYRPTDDPLTADQVRSFITAFIAADNEKFEGDNITLILRFAATIAAKDAETAATIAAKDAEKLLGGSFTAQIVFDKVYAVLAHVQAAESRLSRSSTHDMKRRRIDANDERQEYEQPTCRRPSRGCRDLRHMT